MQELTIKQKLTNYCYFVIFNSILVCFIGVGYFFSDWRNPRHLFIISKGFYSIIFFIFGHVSSIILLWLFIGLLISPINFFTKKRNNFVLSFIFTCLLSCFCLDIVSRYYFSINLVDTLKILHLLSLPDEFPLKYHIIIIISVLLLFIFEFNLIKIIRKININNNVKYIYLHILTIFILTIMSYGIFHFALNKDKQQQIIAKQVLPWFYTQDNFINKVTSINEQSIAKNIKNAILQTQYKANYPIKPLTTKFIESLPNILVIGIDCWRADYFNAVDTPNLWQFAQQGKIFANHQSAGNCTRLGLFGLFYGIPATSWREFLIQQQSSVFIDRLQQLDYSVSSFTHADKNKHPYVYFFLDSIQNKRYIIKGNTSAEVDKNITADWLSWYKSRNTQKPYFSFILYGSVYGNDFPQEYKEKYFPTSGSYRYHDLVKKYGADAFIGTYKTAVNYLDDLASEIIKELKQSKELSNTIIIITSDHGQDFAENSQDFWGHGTNFTDGQIKVPFAIIHPKFNQQQIIIKENSLTTHYDLVPTLMKNFLGVTNNISDYSVGVDLLAKNTKRDCDFVTGNFKWCGISNADYIINFHPSGNYYITDKKNQPLFNKKINNNILYLALKNMFKFSY